MMCVLDTVGIVVGAGDGGGDGGGGGLVMVVPVVL
jgi:hypothetical protein